MSGLEIIGAVAGIFSLLQTSREVVRRVIEARKENSEVPLAFRGLNQALQLVEHSLEDISIQASSNRIDQGLKRKLMRMIRVVQDQILELNGIFQRMIPDGNVSKLRSSWSAVISVGQDKKVQAILQKVVMYQNLLKNAMPAENCLVRYTSYRRSLQGI
jgi:N-terminal domain on NACHT_NTPase and P-loop NTPases